MDCIFCKIASGDIEGDRVYEDDHIVAFRDVNPRAPHHILIIPRQHIATLNDLRDEDQLLSGRLIQAASRIAGELSFADDGYRLVMNCNRDGGQTVFHLHLHLLGGRALGWPPG